MRQFRARTRASRDPGRRFRYGTYRTFAHSSQAGPTRLCERPTATMARPRGRVGSIRTDWRCCVGVAPMASRPPHNYRDHDLGDLPPDIVHKQRRCGTSTGRRADQCCASGNESHHRSARRQRPTRQRVPRGSVAQQRPSSLRMRRIASGCGFQHLQVLPIRRRR
jgi:hypothetical protein